MLGALGGVMGGAGGAGGLLGGLLGGGGAGGAGGLLGTIGGLVGTMFGGPIGGMIGSALGNMVGEAVGEATNQATDKLQKEHGMPKFLADEIKNCVKDAVDSCKNKDVDPKVQHAVDNDKDVQGWKKDFIQELTKSMVENCQKNLENTDESSGAGEAKKGGKKSWLQAMAAAMGSTLGQKAAKMVELSNAMSKLSAEKADMANKRGDKPAGGSEEANAAEFTRTQAELQGVSQEFSLLQSAFSNAIKSIGEGLSQMGRKG